MASTVPDTEHAGHGPAVMFPWDDLGPTKSPLSDPPAVTVYVPWHFSPLTVTIAIPLDIGAVPTLPIR